MELFRSRTMRLFGFVAAMVAILGLSPHVPVQAAGEGDDYASQELGMAWDMSSTDPIAAQQTRIYGNISGLTINNGVLEGNATTGDPRIFLMLPTHVNANAALPEGGVHPIDAGRYRYVYTRIFASTAGQAQIFWQNDANSSYSASGFKDLRAGWNDVVFDLTAGGFGSSGTWSGKVQGFYLDPINKTGAFKVDYVRLSSVPLNNPANGVPQLKINSPSYYSGPDYASATLGNGWDMNDSSDVAVSAFTAISFANGILTGTTANCSGATCGDPSITLRTGGVIDTKRYKYATYRVKIEQDDATKDVGSVTRFLWWPDIPQNASTTRDTFAYEGWRTISLDLTSVKLENDSKASWTNSAPTVFRFDPHEYATPRTYQIDYIALTGDNQANASFDIRYETSDADGNQLTTQFFFDTNNLDFDGRPISCSASRQNAVTAAGQKVYLPLAVHPSTRLDIITGATCHWDTSGLAAGTYYIYGITTDGTDTTRIYSTVPVFVSH